MTPWELIGWMIAIVLGCVLALMFSTILFAFLRGVHLALSARNEPPEPPEPVQEAVQEAVPGSDRPYWMAMMMALVAQRLNVTIAEVERMPVRFVAQQMAEIQQELENTAK